MRRRITAKKPTGVNGICKTLTAFGFLIAQAGFAQVHTVKIINGMKFDPPHIEIELGDTIEFHNQSGGKHTVTADPTLAKNPANVVLPANAAPFHSGEMKSGDTFTHVFDVEGDYQYLCLPHERMNMFGTVFVK